MTVDQRLEALIARHEALTQSVELILAAQTANEARLAQDAENIRALARIAEIHERRLTDLEK